jgi:hypothetical protein
MSNLKKITSECRKLKKENNFLRVPPTFVEVAPLMGSPDD